MTCALDEAMAALMFAHCGGAFTVALSVTFSAAVPLDRCLFVRASIVSEQVDDHRTIAMLEAQILVDQGASEALVTARATFVKPAAVNWPCGQHRLERILDDPATLVNAMCPKKVAQVEARWRGNLNLFQLPTMPCDAQHSDAIFTAQIDALMNKVRWSTTDEFVKHLARQKMQRLSLCSLCTANLANVTFNQFLLGKLMLECFWRPDQNEMHAAVKFLSVSEGPSGNVHGGAVAALLNEALFVCARAHTGSQASEGGEQTQPLGYQLVLDVQFRNPVPINDVLYIVCSVATIDPTASRRRDKITVKGTLTNCDGSIIYAEANCLILTHEHNNNMRSNESLIPTKL